MKCSFKIREAAPIESRLLQSCGQCCRKIQLGKQQHRFRLETSRPGPMGHVERGLKMSACRRLIGRDRPHAELSLLARQADDRVGALPGVRHRQSSFDNPNALSYGLRHGNLPVMPSIVRADAQRSANTGGRLPVGLKATTR